MLDPKKNRLDYGELLIPPTGYILKRAVATTYSLDLNTLLAIPVALFYSKPLEGDYERDRLDVLDSISQASEYITIVCQKGKILSPKKFHKLFAFLEPCITEYKTIDAFSSFHPKVWIIRFEKDNEVIYRIVILTRNLTFDKCLDIAFCMDGGVKSVNKKENQPLVDFLKSIITHTDIKNIETKFIEDLNRCEFDVIDEFNSFKFHPIGPDNINPFTKPQFDELLMISPFVQEKRLTDVTKNIVGKCSLFSRKEEIFKLSDDIIEKIDCYNISDNVRNFEYNNSVSEEVELPEIYDLHAKLYIGKKEQNYKWYLGSANLTNPSVNRNIEFMIELNSEKYKHSPTSIMKELLGNEKERGLFEPFNKTGINDYCLSQSVENQIRRIEHDIVNSEITGKAEINEHGSYSLHLEIDLQKCIRYEEFEITISPIFLNQSDILKPKFINTFLYENIKETTLSPFISFKITYNNETVRSFVLKASIDLPNGRIGRILIEIIDSKEKFIHYLKFLLSESGYSDMNYFDEVDTKNKNKGNGSTLHNFPIYEQMLRIISSNPDKMKSIDRLVERIKNNNTGQQIIPEDFDELWSTFKNTLTMLNDKTRTYTNS